MLVISRRAGERIVIGNDVQVIVTEIKRRSVRIGVVGGRETVILRGEVYESIEAANRAAAEMTFANADLFEGLLMRARRKAGDQDGGETEDAAPPYVNVEELRGDES